MKNFVKNCEAVFYLNTDEHNRDLFARFVIDFDSREVVVHFETIFNNVFESFCINRDLVTISTNVFKFDSFIYFAETCGTCTIFESEALSDYYSNNYLMQVIDNYCNELHESVIKIIAIHDSEVADYIKNYYYCTL